LFDTSQSAVDPIIHHLVPLLADTLRPDLGRHSGPWITDATLIGVHDQSITAPSKNYRRSINTQIIIRAHDRRVVVARRCRPGNRNDVVVARHTLADPRGGTRPATSPAISTGGSTAGSQPASST
jgi:hypothetical protein